MKKATLLLVTASFLFCACKKENNTNPVNHTTHTSYIVYGGDTTEMSNGFFSFSAIYLTNVNLMSKTDSGAMTLIRIYTKMKNAGTYTYKDIYDPTYDDAKNFDATQFTPSGVFFKGGITEYQDFHDLTGGTLNLQLGADSVYQITYDLTLSDAVKGKVTGRYTGKLTLY